MRAPMDSTDPGVSVRGVSVVQVAVLEIAAAPGETKRQSMMLEKLSYRTLDIITWVSMALAVLGWTLYLLWK